MREVTLTFRVYRYDELNEAAKKKAKDDFLQTNIQNDDFQYTLDDFYEHMFPNSDLKYQYSLCYCQGDGFNTYGSLNIQDINEIRRRAASGELYKGIYEPVYSGMTDDEWKLLMAYSDEYDASYIVLPFNRRYDYSLARNIDLEDWSSQILPKDKKKYANVIEKFQHVLRKFFDRLNKYWERYGYDFLYNISDIQFDYLGKANDWEFNENGVLWTLD